MKFQNVHGREGTFTYENKKYSFVCGVLEVDEKDKNNKGLIKFLQDSPAWIDYKPSAEDEAKDLKQENEELKKLLEESSKENEELKALIESLQEKKVSGEVNNEPKK